MRYAILSDIHANYTALRAVEEAVRRLQRMLTADGLESPIEYWFLGDLVGYGPADQAVQCLRWLRQESRIWDDEARPPRWVPGNHDECLGSDLVPSNFADDAKVTLRRQLERFQQGDCVDNARWFKQAVQTAIQPQPAPPNSDLPEEEARSLVIEREGVLTLAFTHAAVSPIDRRGMGGLYLHAHKRSLIAEELRRLQRYVTAERLCLCYGHTHFPLLARLDAGGFNVTFLPIKYNRPIVLEPGCYAINPGSVGQSRDGDPRASYVLVDPEAGTVEFRRAEYDVLEVVAALNKERNAQPHPEYRKAYESLAERLRRADGKMHLDEFRKIYRPPEWDLDVLV